VHTNPLGDYDLPPAADGVTIGLLHADVDQTQSRYAPVPLADLQARRLLLWLLGHVHRANQYDNTPGSPAVLYPGSPQALDPGEPGPHGPWLIEITPGREPQLQHLLIAPLCYETIEVDVTGLDAPVDVDSVVTQGITDRLAALLEASPALEHLRCRIAIVGRTPFGRAIADRLDKTASDLIINHGSTTATVERTMIDTRPATDLHDLARGSSLPAGLARLILELDDSGQGDTSPSLVSAAQRTMETVLRATPYAPIRHGTESPTANDARRMLRQQAVRLLDTLLAQTGGPA
jgi:DNA repair exonuclease SbcCD nuclease subunit